MFVSMLSPTSLNFAILYGLVNALATTVLFTSELFDDVSRQREVSGGEHNVAELSSVITEMAGERMLLSLSTVLPLPAE